MVASQEEKHKYILRTPISLHHEICALARYYGITYNAALNMLLRQAVDAHAPLSPKDS
jgi:hypothetical protein